MNQRKVPITLSAAKARLKAHLGREWTESQRHSQHYQITGPERIRLADKLGLTREEKVGREADANCQSCDDGVLEDAEHLLTGCPASARMRRQIFGRDDPTLREVFSDPDGVVALLRRLGRL